MKIGILEAGLIREELADRYSPYPVMFAELLDRADREIECAPYSPIRGHMPESIDECDGWLISGSRHGVYDKLDWMAPLQDFIREVAAAQKPLIGVCFGHQIIAEALGGKVVKSDDGWVVGLQQYSIERQLPWMGESSPSVAMYAYHQDQVVEMPPGAEIILSADSCPIAGLRYDDSIISVQAHPEFEVEYERELLEMFAGKVIPDEVAQQGLDSLSGEARADTNLMADWFAEFFLSRNATTAASLKRA